MSQYNSLKDILLDENQIKSLKTLKLLTGGIHKELIKKNPHKKLTVTTTMY